MTALNRIPVVWGLVGLVSIFLATACELEAGDEDHHHSDSGDTGADVGRDATEDQPGPTCASDGTCVPGCFYDPDCVEEECDCDTLRNVCNVAVDYTDSRCGCDPDCEAYMPCDDYDGVCDPLCHARDQDCPDDCNWVAGVCEADANHSSGTCDNDPDCGPGEQACSADGHCDTFCDPIDPDGPNQFDCVDPDCDEETDGSCS